MAFRITVLLGFLLLMVYPNMFGKSSGVLGHPSGHRLRRGTWDFCRVKSYTQYYMRDMMTLSTDIINNDMYEKNCESGCDVSFLQTNVCVHAPTANITDVLNDVMTMMYDIGDLIDFVRSRGNIQVEDGHPLWNPIVDAFSGINMGWNNATSHINKTIQAVRPVRRVLHVPAIEKFNGQGNNNELRRGYIVARDIIEYVSCSLRMLTNIC